MSNNPLGLNRDQLSKALGGNYAVIRAFEQLQLDSASTPSTIEEANSLAGQALALAQSQASLIYLLLESVESLSSMPLPQIAIDAEDTEPRFYPGTIANQNSDQVEVTGGSIDGVEIGQFVAAKGSFSNLSASGAITSTVVDGITPMIVASTTRVLNLNAETAGRLTDPTTYPADATDLATAIALVNALKAANVAKGI